MYRNPKKTTARINNRMKMYRSFILKAYHLQKTRGWEVVSFLNAKERKDSDIALVTLLIIAVEARSAFYDALDASRVRAEVEK